MSNKVKAELVRGIHQSLFRQHCWWELPSCITVWQNRGCLYAVMAGDTNSMSLTSSFLCNARSERAKGWKVPVGVRRALGTLLCSMHCCMEQILSLRTWAGCWREGWQSWRKRHAPHQPIDQLLHECHFGPMAEAASHASLQWSLRVWALTASPLVHPGPAYSHPVLSQMMGLIHFCLMGSTFHMQLKFSGSL